MNKAKGHITMQHIISYNKGTRDLPDIYVTGFPKTVPNHTRTEMQLHSPNTHTHQAHSYRWPGLLSDGFSDPVNSWGTLQGLWSH